MLAALQRQILFPRHYLAPDERPLQAMPEIQRIWITSDQGPVEGWYIAGLRPQNAAPGPAVIFAHGNGELIDYWPLELAHFARWGIGVLLCEYRGYGRSAGDPSEPAIAADFQQFHDWLVARPEVDPSRIIFHGRSLGGGAVCLLARRREPAALILQSTFTSVADVARRMLIPRALVVDRFESLDVVSRLRCPLLVIHGRHDSLIPFSHAERLHAAAANSTLVAYAADHNDCPPDWPRYWRDVARFLERAFGAALSESNPL